MFETQEAKRMAVIAVLCLIVGGVAGLSIFLLSPEPQPIQNACELKTGQGAYIFTSDKNMNNETCFGEFRQYNPNVNMGGCVWGKTIDFSDTNQGFGLFNESLCVCFPG